MSLKEIFSMNVRSIRLELNLTQEEGAKKCKMKRQQYAAIENGQGVNLNTVERIAKAFKKEPYELLIK